MPGTRPSKGDSSFSDTGTPTSPVKYGPGGLFKKWISHRSGRQSNPASSDRGGNKQGPSEGILPHILQRGKEQAPSEGIDPNILQKKEQAPSEGIDPNILQKKEQAPSEGILPHILQRGKEQVPSEGIDPNILQKKEQVPSEGIDPNILQKKEQAPSEGIDPNILQKKEQAPSEGILPHIEQKGTGDTRSPDDLKVRRGGPTANEDKTQKAGAEKSDGTGEQKPGKPGETEAETAAAGALGAALEKDADQNDFSSSNQSPQGAAPEQPSPTTPGEQAGAETTPGEQADQPPETPKTAAPNQGNNSGGDAGTGKPPAGGDNSGGDEGHIALNGKIEPASPQQGSDTGQKPPENKPGHTGSDRPQTNQASPQQGSDTGQKPLGNGQPPTGSQRPETQPDSQRQGGDREQKLPEQQRPGQRERDQRAPESHRGNGNQGADMPRRDASDQRAPESRNENGGSSNVISIPTEHGMLKVPMGGLYVGGDFKGGWGNNINSPQIIIGKGGGRERGRGDIARQTATGLVALNIALGHTLTTAAQGAERVARS